MPIAPNDPRLQHCGFAKLVDVENNILFYMRKYEICIGRKSKSADTDLVLGDNMNISRQHALIRYNFDTKAFELSVVGKNGVTIQGNLYTPSSPTYTLQSQDVLQIATFNITFLLPRDPRASRQPAPAPSLPAPAPQQHVLPGHHEQQPAAWNGHAGGPAAAAPAASRPVTELQQHATHNGEQAGQVPRPAPAQQLQQPQQLQQLPPMQTIQPMGQQAAVYHPGVAYQGTAGSVQPGMSQPQQQTQEQMRSSVAAQQGMVQQSAHMQAAGAAAAHMQQAAGAAAAAAGMNHQGGVAQQQAMGASSMQGSPMQS